MYYRSCPHCGSNLDPSERCSCQEKEEAASGWIRTERRMQECPYTPTITDFEEDVKCLIVNM